MARFRRAWASRTESKEVSAGPRSRAPLQTGAAGLCSSLSHEQSREPGSETAGARDASPHRAAPTGAPRPAHGRCSPSQGTGAGGRDRAPARVSPCQGANLSPRGHGQLWAALAAAAAPGPRGRSRIGAGAPLAVGADAARRRGPARGHRRLPPPRQGARARVGGGANPAAGTRVLAVPSSLSFPA